MRKTHERGGTAKNDPHAPSRTTLSTEMNYYCPPKIAPCYLELRRFGNQEKRIFEEWITS
jgi:hypothetical protein